MAIKIDTNQPAVAHHIIDGAVTFPYAVDARSAVSNHPFEWSHSPWLAEDAKRARERLAEHGTVLPPEPELTDEERAALDQYNSDVAAAKARLDAANKKRAEEKAAADQIAADEALVASPPPRPDPAARRPFGRKGEPTPAELKQIEKRNADQAERERIVKEKADVDKLAAIR